MTLKSRIQQIEFKLKPINPGCQPALMVLQYEGEEPVSPTQEQVDKYLAETPKCERCTSGKCVLYFDGQVFRHWD